MSIVDEQIERLHILKDRHDHKLIPDKEYEQSVLEAVLELEKLLVNKEPKTSSRMTSQHGKK